MLDLAVVKQFSEDYAAVMTNTDDKQKVRVFFALWPHADERRALAAWQIMLERTCGGRAMRAEYLHATLVFLGDVAVERLEALQLAAQEVRSAPFSLVLDVAHYWGHNRIVFAAPTYVPPELSLLVNDLEQSLRRHHFKFDARSYKPHVTLLRKARWNDTPLPRMPAVTWKISDFALVGSMPNEQGSHYEVLARFSAII